MEYTNANTAIIPMNSNKWAFIQIATGVNFIPTGIHIRKTKTL